MMYKVVEKKLANPLDANWQAIDYSEAPILGAEDYLHRILSAVETAGIAGDCYITGMDCEITACAAINKGTMGMSVWTDIKECATRCGEIAVALAKGEEFEYDEMVQNGDYEVPKVFVPIMKVDKDNLQEWVDTIAPEGWITMEDIENAA